MSKINKIILIFLLLFSYKTYAEIYICDSGDYLNNCESGIKINNINLVESFSGNYINPYIGAIGENKNLEKNRENKLVNYVGYFGYEFDDLSFKETANYTPIGNFSFYDNLEFYDLKTTIYSGGEIILKNSSGNNNSKNTCPSLNSGVENIKIEFIQDNYNKKIKISFDNFEDFSKVEIKRVQPKSNIFNLNKGEFYDDYIEGRNKYLYMIYSYNDCGNFYSSDFFELNIDENEIDNSEIILEENIIKFTNFYNTKSYLTCEFSGEKFIDKKEFDSSFEYQISSNRQYDIYSCFVEYYDKENNFKKSKIVFNDIFDKNLLTNLEVIEFLTGNKIVNKQNYYYLVDFKKINNYIDFAHLYINLKTDFTILDRELSYNIFNDLGIYKDIKNPDKKIYFSEIQKIISNINLIEYFDKKVLEKINSNFDISKKIEKDINFIYNLNNYLKAENNIELISCFILNGCNQIEKYWEIKYDLEKNKFTNKYEINSQNYKNYFEILFKTFLDKSEYKYFDSEKNNFVNILINSLNLGEDSNKQIDYFSYERMNLFLINSNLQNKIYKLSKYLPEINNLYNNTNNKENFHSKILEYLNK